MRTEIRNRNGEVSHYGLACGYVDVKRAGGAEVRLTKPSPGGGVFDVDVWGPGPGPTRTFLDGRLTGWAQYDNLTDARRAARTFAARLRRGEQLWAMPL